MDLRSILMHLQCELVAERSLVNPLDISWLQYDVLLQLDREHEMLPSELSLVMGISRTKLSKALLWATFARPQASQTAESCARP